MNWKQRLAWSVRLLLLWSLLRWAAAPRPLIVLGEPQTVKTRYAKTCVHTRMENEVEEWKIQRTLLMVRELGAQFVVEYFPWAYYEGAEGDYNFTHPDQVMAHAANQGITVIARLGMVPQWAREKNTVDTSLSPKYYESFAKYVGKFVERYRGQIKYLILWNEPNLALEWGYRPPEAREYMALLSVAYRAAKAANPEIQILAGALAPTLEPESSELGMDDLIYLQKLYDAGFANYYDILAVHAYGLSFSPEEPPAPNALNFRRVELVRELMLRNGEGYKQIMITEAGWNDSPRWSRAVKPAVRADYTVQAYAWAEQHWDYVLATCMWAFRFPGPLYTYGDYYAFVTPDFTPRAVYEAVRKWTGN